MNYIFLDLEWNGVYNHSLKRPFNHIIEIGAVKTDSKLHYIDSFRVFVKQKSKLSSRTTRITGLKDSDLEEGFLFNYCLAKFVDWMGDEPSVICGWGREDASVLLENIKCLTSIRDIDFFQDYIDVQRYYGDRNAIFDFMGIALKTAVEHYQIDMSELEAHRALSDALILHKIVETDFDEELFIRYAIGKNLLLSYKPYGYYFNQLFEKPQFSMRLKCRKCGGFLKKDRILSDNSYKKESLHLCTRCKLYYYYVCSVRFDPEGGFVCKSNTKEVIEERFVRYKEEADKALHFSSSLQRP